MGTFCQVAAAVNVHQRNIQTNNQKIKETAFNIYVRPQLEYCASIWHPCQKTLTYKGGWTGGRGYGGKGGGGGDRGGGGRG